MFWNKKKIVEMFKQYFGNYYNFWTSMRFHIEKCDFARYALLYIYGGFYVDLDFGCLASFENLRNRNILMTREAPGLTFVPWDNEPAIFNGFLGSCARNKFWIKFMDYIMYTYSLNKTVMDNTGPVALGRFGKIMGVYEDPDLYFIDNCMIRPETGFGEFKYRNCKDIPVLGRYVSGTGSGWQKDVMPTFVFYMAKKYSLFIALVLLLIILFLLLYIVK